ncbi:MAG: hypothetical protein F4106_03190 [Gemmatimonadetes bacterium]|nr:hypothetical protein [Gemmatimonadota bacterium]MYC90405.1 hypothetical protein [Gemmatimonadota bacterium]MYJ17044.1 hypothetical protein [Gemmatimonadota bacterium]
MAAQRPTAIRGLTFLAVLVACRGPDAPPAPERPESLEQVFVVESVVEIGEDPADSIADVGEFLERRAGGFVITDRLLPRIRSYGEDGRLEAAFGRFGDGPFELRQVSGLAETPSGKLVVADSRRSALVYLTHALRPDTIVRVPGAPRRIVSIGPDLIVRMDPFAGGGPSRLVAKPPLFHRLSGGRVAWSAYPARFSPAERPYWGSFATNLVAVAGDSVFVMTSLTYPITVISSTGDSVGTMGRPSGSFRQIPVFERGEFAGPSTALPEVLASFDVVGRLDVLAGSHLVVTHSRYDETDPSPSLRRVHSTLDIYDRHTGAKLHEDVPLPERSKVLGGGRFLYLLLNQDTPPWRIAKLRLSTGRDASGAGASTPWGIGG